LSCSAPVFEHDLAECRQTHAHEDGAWWGFLLVELTLGSLQIMFDRGQEDDWFASESITALTIAVAVSFVPRRTRIFEDRDRNQPLRSAQHGSRIRQFKQTNIEACPRYQFNRGVLTESSRMRASGTTASFCANLDTPQPSTEL
jgi:hypothetical protein